MTYTCLDQNMLRGPELRDSISEAQIRFVLPDAAIMEMCKSPQWESTMRASLASLSSIPERVLCTLGNGELLTLELHRLRPLTLGDLIDARGTEAFRSVLLEVAGGQDGPAFAAMRDNWSSSIAKMAGGHLNHEGNAAALQALIPTIRDHLSKSCLRRFRGCGIEENERIRIVSGITNTIFPAVMKSRGVDDDRASILLSSKSFIARYLWLRVYNVVRWIELGGSDAVRPENVTNEVVDNYYVLVGSYCDRLVTRDGNASDSDRRLRAALSNDFEWGIDVNYLSAE